MPRIYYGWYVVAMAVLIYMLTIGITNSAFGVFVVPVSRELALTRAQTNSAMIFYMVGTAVMAPLMGRLLDRMRVKTIAIVSAVILGSGLVGLGLSRSLPLSAMLIGLPIAGGTLGCAALTMNVLVARWFRARRGRAMVLGQSGMALGSVVVAPLCGILTEHFGWRSTLIIYGTAMTVILVALLAWVKDRPRPDEIEDGEADRGLAAPIATETAEKPAGWWAVLTTPVFWSVVLGLAAAMGVSQAILVSLPPLAQDAGYSAAQAASFVTMMGIGAVGGSLLVAVIADRIERPLFLSIVLTILAAATFAPSISQSPVVLVVVAVAAGFSAMTTAPLVYALLADLFGAANFGTVQGLTSPAIAVMMGAGVRLSGEVFDRTGNYHIVFVVLALVELVAAGLLFSARFAGAAGARQDASARVVH